MRRRLTLAILLLVAATIVVTSLGAFYFIRRTAISTAQQQLAAEGRSISDTFTGTTVTRAATLREFRIIRQAGNFDDINLVRLTPAGRFLGALPSDLTDADLRIPQLQEGEQVSGHLGQSLVYTAVPTVVPGVTHAQPVLVATRTVRDPTTGLRYFILAGAVALFLAAAVAAALSRRFTRPLEAAAATTAQIAAGDLDARVEVPPRQDPEFTRLAEAINTMGADLVRAREQERQFLLTVSHELRTPLTSIRGYADAVVDGAAEDPAAAAAIIGTEARRLERLVRDLLDLARLDAHRFSLTVIPVDGSAVVNQVANGFGQHARGLGLELASATNGPLWVLADPDRFAQVLANLVENAAGFARHRIEVGVGEVAGTPVAWVSDDGPGIPADQVGRVFERHFVSDRVRGRREGSGLGLAIVAELVSAMGGSVVARSPLDEGGGTRIEVRLRPAGSAILGSIAPPSLGAPPALELPPTNGTPPDDRSGTVEPIGTDERPT